jgi:hypothetical protein
MRVPAFPIVASLVLLAAPAFAQNGTASNSDQNSGYNSNGMTGSVNSGMSGYSNSGTNTYNGTIGGYNQPSQGYQQNATNGYSNHRSITADTKDRIRQSLMQSGFRDVRVVPEAFVIHAQAPDGSRVVMLLRPDEVTGVVEQTGSSTDYSNNGASDNNNWNNGSSNSNNGANH